MVVITNLIMLGIAVVCAVTLAFIILDFVADKVKSKSSKKRNRVHFYVARDKNGLLYLYVGKPERAYSCFLALRGYCICRMEKECDFENFGLNENDYKDLKWEDEPVEVFVNMED